jgi:hypothetical protein
VVEANFEIPLSDNFEFCNLSDKIEKKIGSDDSQGTLTEGKTLYISPPYKLLDRHGTGW